MENTTFFKTFETDFCTGIENNPFPPLAVPILGEGVFIFGLQLNLDIKIVPLSGEDVFWPWTPVTIPPIADFWLRACARYMVDIQTRGGVEDKIFEAMA